jgi:TPR repeat protein
MSNHRKLAKALSANAAPLLAAVVIFNVAHNTRDRKAGKILYPQHSFGFGQIILSSSSRALCEDSKSETESQRFDRALVYHQSQISSYQRKWEYSANSSATTSTKTPSRSWPDNIPPDEDLNFLLEDVKYCNRSDKFSSNNNYCNTLRFRVASSLLMQYDDESQKRGLEMLKNLAEKGHSDAMTFYGMCLNDGRAGMEPAPKSAISCFRRCSAIHGHPQSQYELGVAYYTGEGVAENEEEAVRLFKLAAESDHPAACYMLGDCLLDGIGVDVDRALALEWLVKAAELGHRGARSRVMAVLEKKVGEDYGGFTDASRQTILSEPFLPYVNKEGDNRNPAELVRRQTIVSKSRKE